MLIKSAPSKVNVVAQIIIPGMFVRYCPHCDGDLTKNVPRPKEEA
jgi:alkyl hydroperoxide reductase subunit AhpF